MTNTSKLLELKLVSYLLFQNFVKKTFLSTKSPIFSQSKVNMLDSSCDKFFFCAFQIVAFQNYTMDSRLRGNDVGGLTAVIPAKAGIYCKTIQYLCFALYTTWIRKTTNWNAPGDFFDILIWKENPNTPLYHFWLPDYFVLLFQINIYVATFVKKGAG